MVLKRLAGKGPVWAKIIVALIDLAILAVCVLLADDPEDHSSVAYLQYVPYLVFLLPALLSLACSFLLGWLWRALALIGVGLVVTNIMGLVIGHPDMGTGRLRFMTYNAKVMYAFDDPVALARLAAEVSAHNPDVLVLQDAREMAMLQVTKPQAYHAIMGDREAYLFGQYAVASRFPLTDCEQGAIPYGKEHHTYLHCVVLAHGKAIDLITVHFRTPRGGLYAVRQTGAQGIETWRENMSERVMQSQELAEILSKLKGTSRIVAGDLNAPERSTVVQNLLNTGLRDAFSSAGWGYGYSYGHSVKPWISFLRIDHILVSPDIGVVDAYAGGKTASQHRPVIADLLINRF